MLVGDVDMLSDRLWVQVQNFLGQRLVNAFANNGDFVINALDNLSGSADLIGLRSRATYSRPFTTVDELRRDADAKFRETEKQLQAATIGHGAQARRAPSRAATTRARR